MQPLPIFKSDQIQPKSHRNPKNSSDFPDELENTLLKLKKCTYNQKRFQYLFVEQLHFLYIKNYNNYRSALSKLSNENTYLSAQRKIYGYID